MAGILLEFYQKVPDIIGNNLSICKRKLLIDSVLVQVPNMSNQNRTNFCKRTRGERKNQNMNERQKKEGKKKSSYFRGVCTVSSTPWKKQSAEVSVRECFLLDLSHMWGKQPQTQRDTRSKWILFVKGKELHHVLKMKASFEWRMSRGHWRSTWKLPGVLGVEATGVVVGAAVVVAAVVVVGAWVVVTGQRPLAAESEKHTLAEPGQMHENSWLP